MLHSFSITREVASKNPMQQSKSTSGCHGYYSHSFNPCFRHKPWFSQQAVSLNFNNYYGGGVTWHYLVLLSIIGDDIVSATFLTISYRQVGILPIRFADIIGNHWSSPMPIADLPKLADIVSATALPAGSG